jgi:hypothetical protein
MKGSTRPVGDPELTVKLFELFRARYTEQLAKKAFLSIKSSNTAGLISKL